jgi:hypothetical protein
MSPISLERADGFAPLFKDRMYVANLNIGVIPSASPRSVTQQHDRADRDPTASGTSGMTYHRASTMDVLALSRPLAHMRRLRMADSSPRSIPPDWAG